jgi:nucleoid DNA-binding protein
MTKAEVIAQIGRLTTHDEEKIKIIIPVLLTTIINTLAEGEAVVINGFGTFHTKLRHEKIGRDIPRNKLMIIPSHYIPHLRPHGDFKQQVKTTNQSGE